MNFNNFVHLVNREMFCLFQLGLQWYSQAVYQKVGQVCGEQFQGTLLDFFLKFASLQW